MGNTLKKPRIGVLLNAKMIMCWYSNSASLAIRTVQPAQGLTKTIALAAKKIIIWLN